MLRFPENVGLVDIIPNQNVYPFLLKQILFSHTEFLLYFYINVRFPFSLFQIYAPGGNYWGQEIEQSLTNYIVTCSGTLLPLLLRGKNQRKDMIERLE